MTNEEYLKSLDTKQFAQFIAECSRNQCQFCINFLHWNCDRENCVLGFTFWLREPHEED